jgi:hypothetical protein
MDITYIHTGPISSTHEYKKTIKNYKFIYIDDISTYTKQSILFYF